MFDKVLIELPDTQSTSSKEYRLYPFLYLIANEVLEAGHRRTEQPSFIQRSLLTTEGRPNILDSAMNNEGVLFTTNVEHKALYLQNQGITTENAALLLAAAGLEITVPNITFDIARSEEIITIREKLIEEREKYLISVIQLTNETFDRLTSGVYNDTVDWALNEAFLKIKPKAIEFEQSMAKLNRNLLKRVGYNFISEGIPHIGSALVNKGFKEAAKVSTVKILEVLSKNLVKSIEERKMPEVVYGYKINKQLNDTKI
ncbi:hypothetical protein [Sulfurimonas sp.]|uniref:hypothetical protein n=1 Tax=Sulfurimonas sp. TaxID=2022749 RepID=UPI002AB0A830|nr:hypothetical protein [Sulfurimonas sp.]